MGAGQATHLRSRLRGIRILTITMDTVTITTIRTITRIITRIITIIITTITTARITHTAVTS